MKKILIIFTLVLMIFLTACEEGNNNELLNINDFDEMELTLGEKINFLTNLDLNNQDLDGFSFNQYYKGNMNAYFYSNIKTLEIQTENTMNLSYNIDYDGTLYMKYPEDLNEFLVYGSINKLKVFGNIETETETKVTGDMNDYFEEATISLDINLNNSMFLLLEKDAYFRLNGKVKVTEDELVMVDEDYNNLKEKVLDIINNDDYENFKESLEETFLKFEGLEDMFPNLDGMDGVDELEQLNNLVKIFKKGDEYIINTSLTTELVYEYLDLFFADEFVGVEGETDFVSLILEAISQIKDYLKQLDFDFNIYIKNNQIIKVSLDLKFDLDEIDFSFNESDEYNSTTIIFDGNLKIEKLGFIIDFNANKPTNIPNASDLLDYQVVDEPSFGGLFE